MFLLQIKFFFSLLAAIIAYISMIKMSKLREWPTLSVNYNGHGLSYTESST